jgi:hypothetical protein
MFHGLKKKNTKGSRALEKPAKGRTKEVEEYVLYACTPLKTLSSPALITDHLWNQVRSIRLVEAHLRLFIFLRIDTHTSGINSSHSINSKFASDPIQLVSMSIEGRGSTVI